MTVPASLRYVKMNGLGNEIVALDLRGLRAAVTGADARAIAARAETHFDQLMVMTEPKTRGTAAYVLIFNSDGSESAACGNGTRCIAWLEFQRTGSPDHRFETKAGLLDTHVESLARITVDMGEPRFKWNEIPLAEPFHDTRGIELQIGPIDAPILHSPAVVNVGNPHAVFFVDDVAAYDMARIGPMLECHPIFPERANISIAEITGEDAIRVVTWERGAGLTRACGTAACAVAVSAMRKKLTGRRVTVTLPGGPLDIQWTDKNRILMTGPAALEHEGTLGLGAEGFATQAPARAGA